MSKNSLSDLNDHLFAQLERLGDESLSAEQIETEVRRSEAIVAVGDQVTELANIQLKAAKLFAEHGNQVLDHLPRIAKARPKGDDQ